MFSKIYVVENNFYIFAITETWLRVDEQDRVTIGDLTPTGYSFLHTARKGCRGGGDVGLLYKTSLNMKRDSTDYFDRFKSFEAIVMQIKVLSQAVHIIIIYRPPSSSVNNRTTELFLMNSGHSLRCSQLNLVPCLLLAILIFRMTINPT